MGKGDWIDGAKEIIIGALVIEKAQEYWMNAYVLGGFVDGIDPSIKPAIEVMLAFVVILAVGFGIYLVVRGMKSAITKW